jgi:hypothetical protein
MRTKQSACSIALEYARTYSCCMDRQIAVHCCCACKLMRAHFSALCTGLRSYTCCVTIAIITCTVNSSDIIYFKLLPLRRCKLHALLRVRVYINSILSIDATSDLNFPARSSMLLSLSPPMLLSLPDCCALELGRAGSVLKA